MIKNLSKKTEVEANVKISSNFIDKTFGLILERRFDGILFKTRFGIHTFFMRKSIDILILDNDNKVVNIKKGLTPFNFYFWNPKYSKVLELKHGLIESSITEIGDKIKIV